MISDDGTLFLGRQPIVDRDSQLVGYELFYRNTQGTSEMKNEHYATANVLTHTLSLTGIDGVIGKHLAFVNINESFLQHDMIHSIPAERFIFELDDTLNFTEENLKRLEELYLQGYSFAFCINDLQDHTFTAAKKVAKIITYIKLNTIQVQKEKLMKVLLTLGSSNKRLIASHIEDEALFKSFSEMGFELFQGYFFAKPEILESQQASSSSANVINLCNLLSTDSSMEEVTEAFSHSPDIVIQLIQYMNSCAFNLKGSIDSIERVITLIGRKALVQWLFLTLYASANDSTEDSALLILVKQRTQLLIDILIAAKPDASKDELSKASFVGLLSSIDVILKTPLPDLLEKLNIDETIKDALLEKKGLLGEIYEVSIAIEQFDLAKTEAFIIEHEIAPDSFQKLLFRSFESANDFKPKT